MIIDGKEEYKKIKKEGLEDKCDEGDTVYEDDKEDVSDKITCMKRRKYGLTKILTRLVNHAMSQSAVLVIF